jgi:alkylhydroperoxidase family enzyme
MPDTQDVPDDVYEQAIKVFNEPQYQAVAWMINVTNMFNRLAVPSRAELPRRAA